MVIKQTVSNAINANTAIGNNRRIILTKPIYPELNRTISEYIKEGVGIRGIARLLEISTTTLIKRIISISKDITAPHVTANAEYEVDEIKIFVGRKKIISGWPML